jgi:hypothetical protein
VRGIVGDTRFTEGPAGGERGRLSCLWWRGSWRAGWGGVRSAARGRAVREAVAGRDFAGACG